MILSITQNIKTLGAYPIIIFTIFLTLSFTFVILDMYYHRFDIIGFLNAIIQTVVLFISNNKPLKITLFVILILVVIYQIVFFILKDKEAKIINKKTLEQLKNDSYDYYFSFNKKRKIIDCSYSFLTLSKRSKKELKKTEGWSFIFRTLGVQKINNEEFIIPNENLFLSHLDEVVSKYNMHEFTLETYNTEGGSNYHYTGLLQPIYMGKKIIATNLYLYRDKMTIINDLSKKMDKASYQITNFKNVTHILMSLSEGIALYYDYQEKLYYTTEAFRDYVDEDKSFYTFQEIYAAIHDEDRDNYAEQSQTINSIHVTRIKFRLRVKGKYFYAVEDSIYLHKDESELVSIIHLVGPVESIKEDNIISTKEVVDLVDNMSKEVIAPIVFETKEALNEALSKYKEEPEVEETEEEKLEEKVEKTEEENNNEEN